MADKEYIGEERRTHDARLSRIEQKLDKINDAIIALARAEEKLIALEKDRLKMSERIDKIEQHIIRQMDKMDARMDSIEKAQTRSNVLYKISLPFFSAILAGAAGYFIKGQ